MTELRQKAQVTIPREIIVKLGLSEGDKLDIFEKDGSIVKETSQSEPYDVSLTQPLRRHPESDPDLYHTFTDDIPLCGTCFRNTAAVRLYIR